MEFDNYLEDAIEEVLDQTLTQPYLEQLSEKWLEQKREGAYTFNAFYVNHIIGSLIFLFSSYNSLRMSELTKEQYKMLSDIAVAHVQKNKMVIESFMKK